TNPAATQFTGLTTQLNYGIRLLNLDIHWETKNGRRELYLCHGKCWILNRGRAADMLREVTTFMNANPREVVTIVFENAAGANAAEIEAVFREAGLLDRLYSQPASSPTWPTLGELIDRNKRLIVFAPGLPSIPAGQPQPLIMNQFDYVSETPYALRSEADWNCALDRPGGQARPLVLVNHWIYGKVLFIPIDVPSANNAKWVNKADKIRGHLNKCQSVRGQRVNYVLVDFYEYGDLTEVVAGLNGVPYVAKPRPETKWRPLADGDAATIMAAPEVQALARLAKENDGKPISLDALDRGATVGITE
ncbi:PLC-like phosphodiesterase, partial [Catenaria anguillulae PL171]